MRVQMTLGQKTLAGELARPLPVWGELIFMRSAACAANSPYSTISVSVKLPHLLELRLGSHEHLRSSIGNLEGDERKCIGTLTNSTDQQDKATYPNGSARNTVFVVRVRRARSRTATCH